MAYPAEKLLKQHVLQQYYHTNTINLELNVPLCISQLT